MFDFFWNWLDPKILRMERWVNLQVVQPDKIDIDLDKVKKGEVRENDMFRKAIPGTDGQASCGPYLTNLSGSKLLGFMYGPGLVEAFALLEKDEKLWWRHRVDGTTEDFTSHAFDNMLDFFTYVHGDKDVFWECVLRTRAMLVDHKLAAQPELTITAIDEYVPQWNLAHAPEAPTPNSH